MNAEKEVKPICHNCENYEVSPGGCVETCHAIRRESWIRLTGLKNYTVERMNANKMNCKMFQKI